MSNASDLTDGQWALLGRRSMCRARADTSCQWRFLPESFWPWTRVWSQFRRWPCNGAWARADCAARGRERSGG